MAINDVYTNGVFRSSDGSAITWAQWAPDDPNGADTDNCVYIVSDNGSMIDDDCLHEHEYICQSMPG